MDKKIILQKLDRAKNLPTLPTVALKVNEMLNDYDVSVDQLTKVLEKDQSIVLKLLKLVNSAFYGFKSKIKNIPHAVTLMGYNTLRNAVITVSVIDAFKIQDQIEGFDINKFWFHSIEVAVIAKYLSENTRLHPAEETFTFGLLHDIGKLVQLTIFSDLFKSILFTAKEKNISYFEAEQQLSIMSHARMGAYLAQKWLLPQDFVEVIKYHHIIKEGHSNYNSIVVIHIADMLSNATIGIDCMMNQLHRLNPETKTLLLKALKCMPVWFPKAQAEIKTASQFFMEE
ncbi:MAG: HDOD domain-containing protein [Desulfobacteraceae bacterium]|jgi:putative nucleotidyltransferase with HDIG domain